MFVTPGQSIKFTVGGTATGNVGQKVYSYVIRTDGNNNAILEFFKDSLSGTQIWEDEVISTDLARPFSFPAMAPLGYVKDGIIVARILGTGASVYINYD